MDITTQLIIEVANSMFYDDTKYHTSSEISIFDDLLLENILCDCLTVSR